MGAVQTCCHNRMGLASLTVTPLSPLSPGGCTDFHTYHVCVTVMGSLEGKGMLVQITVKMNHFVSKEVRRKSGGAFMVGFLSINLSTDYPGTEEINVMQIHL